MEFYLKIKSIIDRLVALFLLLISSPLMLFCVLAVKLEDPAGKAVFSQERVGKDCKLFTVYKFRSMKELTELNGVTLSDTDRMLRCGRWLRALSLDELPQLLNILKGEMSFIGPRPLPVLYLPYFNQQEIKRHLLKPGISGLAQVNGRNNLTWDEKFKFDLEYVNTVNLALDLKILLLTFFKVINKNDIGVRGEDKAVDFHTYRINQRKEQSDDS